MRLIGRANSQAGKVKSGGHFSAVAVESRVDASVDVAAERALVPVTGVDGRFANVRCGSVEPIGLPEVDSAALSVLAKIRVD